ncbi:PLP-dependent aminotransferase family protein [Jannaschia seohaensis]|uniref:GntR family transcriptional regulator / MocR family aminotransferase n=1 Tax=Jannaschia seohaensis TaxID=475081 RepID=A0A2Y9AB96_9RHOB|nr:PLP-dependent aminotransferase family protein [Jannaschia seohaensis]PWJ20826.1 GntR family transcriptional regulator/MocR family aminotransferase [Jannaschia seohaensis]SSA41236.1 GntR family transcriptional regulator / MocR family aminotransferase [Jannaschia seohaensis]
MAIAAESFVLDPGHTGTLQRQLQEIVTGGILSGRFRPGDRMPSSRGLARHLGISRITVTLAYTELVANDYLTSRGRSGYFVSDSAPTPPVLPVGALPVEDRVDWNAAMVRRFSAGPDLERPRDWRSYRYPFIYGQTDARLFDHRNWRRCALQALGARDFEATTSDSYGRDDALLVEQIVRHILPRRGIAAEPDQVLITLGAQNALWMVSRILLTQDRLAAIEHPGYPALRTILGRSGARSVALQIDAAGLPPESVPPETDVVFVTPSHHCPTSATMPVARRRELLARADRDDFLIVEDDYEFELAFAAPPAPALKSLDRSGRVIYIGSFAKSLFPGLRLGYLVASAPFIAEARALRSLLVRHVPGHLQRAAAYFLEQGHYDAQIHRMARVYRERRATAEAAIAAHGLTALGANTFGGSSFWMQSRDVPAEILAARLRNRGVLIEPGGPFFGADDPGDRYRLAYSSIAREDIPEGLRRIAEAGG